MEVPSTIQSVDAVLRQFAPDVLAYFGVVGGVLTLTDWLLGEKPKKWIKTASDNTWLFLAEQGTGRFLTIVRIRYVQIYIALLGISLVIYGQTTLISTAIRQGTIRITSVSQFSFDLAYKAVLLILVSYFVLPRLVDMLTRRGSVWWCLFKIFIANEVIEGLYLAVKLTVVYTGLLSFRDDLVPVWHGSRTLNIVVETFLLPLEFLAMQIRAVFVLSFAWLLLVLALMLLLRVLQFLVFRIATYDKGPVLAISALMTACGAMLKFFVGSGATSG